MNGVAGASLVLLMVEDNPADVYMFREAMEAAQMYAAVHVVDNGRDALLFLRRQGPYAHAPRPDVMVLDLNLPVKNGQQVLVDMLAEPELEAMPVAILTASTSEKSVCELCRPGHCLYFTKTDDFRLLQDIIRQIAAHAKRSSGIGHSQCRRRPFGLCLP